jgi:hypothetical protein
MRVWLGALGAEPRALSWDFSNLHGRSKYSLQGAVELLAFMRFEVIEASCRVNPASPQHLVGQHVAQTG